MASGRFFWKLVIVYLAFFNQIEIIMPNLLHSRYQGEKAPIQLVIGRLLLRKADMYELHTQVACTLLLVLNVTLKGYGADYGQFQQKIGNDTLGKGLG